MYKNKVCRELWFSNTKQARHDTFFFTELTLKKNILHTQKPCLPTSFSEQQPSPHPDLWFIPHKKQQHSSKGLKTSVTKQNTLQLSNLMYRRTTKYRSQLAQFRLKKEVLGRSVCVGTKMPLTASLLKLTCTHTSQQLRS